MFMFAAAAERTIWRSARSCPRGPTPSSSDASSLSNREISYRDARLELIHRDHVAAAGVDTRTVDPEECGKRGRGGAVTSGCDDPGAAVVCRHERDVPEAQLAAGRDRAARSGWGEGGGEAVEAVAAQPDRPPQLDVLRSDGQVQLLQTTTYL